MTNFLKTQPFTLGFTLLETIIYIALFSSLFTGMIVSMYPIFSGAERLTTRLLKENEAHFILSKIEHALAMTITSAEGKILTPIENASSDELKLGTETNILYTFTISSSNVLCSTPRLCSFLTLSTSGNVALPLTNERLRIENFHVTHTSPSSVENKERTLDVSFTIDGDLIGPIRYYLRF